MTELIDKMPVENISIENRVWKILFTILYKNKYERRKTMKNILH